MKGGKIMKRRTWLSRTFFWLFMIVPALWASVTLGATLNVPSTDYPNIQAAIDAALPGDTVSVAPGTYTGPGNVNLLIQGRSINIEGSGSDSCIIDCEGSGRAFTFTGVETSDSVLSGFTVKGGKVADYGGGITCRNSSPTIRDCDIVDNTSAFGGGGLYIENSSPTIEECSISNNEGGYFGAGVYLTNSSQPTLSSCLIARNSAMFFGGGIFCSTASSPKITNCTVADNLVNDPTYAEGAGIYSGSSSVRITNSIFWRDAAASGPEIYLASSELYVSYSDVQGGKAAVVMDPNFSPSTLNWDDATNIDADPLFVGQDDYHLSPKSPCIDAGIDTGDLPDVDFEENPRILNGRPDMGADETTRTDAIVGIDIKPGSRQKEIDLRDKGVVPVAVLSSKDFDARMIDPKSVLFAGAAPVRSVLQDTDRDYRLDMLFFFKIQQLHLDENSTDSTLTGKTVDDVSFEGTDSVTIYRPKYNAKSGWKWAKIKHMYRHKHVHRHSSK
jgi:parallel beta-helix repeat protein